MLTLHKKITESLSNNYEYLKREAAELYSRVTEVIIKLSHISYSIQKVQDETKKIDMALSRIENHLFQKDTEMIIHNGKRYRIAESQLTAEAGERTILDLHCVEYDDD